MCCHLWKPLPSSSSVFYLFILFLVGQGFELRISCCKAGALLLEPHDQSSLLWLFWRCGLLNYLPGLSLNSNPPNLSLLSSWDFRHEPPTSGSFIFLLKLTLPHPFSPLLMYTCLYYRRDLIIFAVIGLWIICPIRLSACGKESLSHAFLFSQCLSLSK
jgi:hypothetical protein